MGSRRYAEKVAILGYIKDEPCLEKTRFLHMRKQSAVTVQLIRAFFVLDLHSAIPLPPKSEISSF